MPLIKPEVQKILRAAGLAKEPAEGTLVEKLQEAGLDNESIAEGLTSLALHSQNESLRLRAIETALRVNGSLKETPSQLPQFTIIIQNSGQDLDTTGGLNPIIFPRQSLVSKLDYSKESKESKERKEN